MVWPIKLIVCKILYLLHTVYELYIKPAKGTFSGIWAVYKTVEDSKVYFDANLIKIAEL